MNLLSSHNSISQELYMLVTLFVVRRTFTSRGGTDSNSGDSNVPADMHIQVGECTRYVYYVIANFMYSL